MKTFSDYSKIKKELLCYGIRIAKAAESCIQQNNYYTNQNKSVHAAVFQLADGSFVNATINEEFTKTSPYLLNVCNNNLALYKNGCFCSTIQMHTTPLWYKCLTSDGIRMNELLSLHGSNTLAFTSHNSCRFKCDNEGCLFCSSNQGKDIPSLLQAKHLCEVLEQALKENPDYSLALSGGTRYGKDCGLIHFSEIVREVKKHFPNITISVESVAPFDLVYIDTIIDAGVSTLIMNLEFSDPIIRQKYCPGKSKISKELYYSAYQKAVVRLGPWNVSSVLIAGLEPISNTINESMKLIDCGVTPTIMPFRPYDKCTLRNHSVTNATILDEIEDALTSYLISKGIRIKKSYACLNCNACIAIDIL